MSSESKLVSALKVTAAVVALMPLVIIPGGQLVVLSLLLGKPGAKAGP